MRRDGAVERLVQGYQDQLFSFALRLLRNPLDAQEVTQDVFLRAIKALATQYDAERCRDLALRPWLFRITRNLAHNKRRSRSAVREVQFEQESDIHGAALRKNGQLSAHLRAERKLEALDQALGRLDSSSRELVLLRFMEELPYKDIAVTVGGTEASARARIFRALGKLRRILSRMEVNNAL
jgi:RNA polymerase sigma-70 factor (ECF subfamily)